MTSVVADLGGTNVRFGRVDPKTGQTMAIAAFPLAQFERFDDGLRRYLNAHSLGGELGQLAIGAAGPVVDGRVRLTNAPWHLDAGALSQAFACPDVRIVNDLQAVGFAIPTLASDDIDILFDTAGVDVSAKATRLAVNVGTGFGASACVFVPDAAGGRWLAMATEAGHVSDAFADATTTVEALCSGSGLVARANRCAVALGQEDRAFASARDVVTRANEAAANDALKAFGRTLGRATRDLVLAHGAWGGVYLVGSVIDGWLSTTARETFLEGYGGDNPMHSRLDAVPIVRVKADQPALRGLAAMLTNEGYEARLQT